MHALSRFNLVIHYFAPLNAVYLPLVDINADCI